MEKKARAIWVAAAQNAGGQMSSQARRLRWVRSGGGVRHETAGDGRYRSEPGRQAKVYYTYFTWLTCRTRLLFAPLCVAPSGLCGLEVGYLGRRSSAMAGSLAPGWNIPDLQPCSFGMNEARNGPLMQHGFPSGKGTHRCISSPHYRAKLLLAAHGAAHSFACVWLSAESLAMG
jgi:hypothetical protein